MNELEAMKAGFYDELEKIAGEMQGFTRIGRKPIGIEKMLENETEQASPSETFTAGTTKLSAPDAETTRKVLKVVAPLAAGAGIYHIGARAERDRRLGRQMRLQNQGY